MRGRGLLGRNRFGELLSQTNETLSSPTRSDFSEPMQQITFYSYRVG